VAGGEQLGRHLFFWGSGATGGGGGGGGGGEEDEEEDDDDDDDELFSENHAVCEIMWKNMAQLDRTQLTRK
jgi:hypothetical protein